jgi:hypothetical protein
LILEARRRGLIDKDALSFICLRHTDLRIED